MRKQFVALLGVVLLVFSINTLVNGQTEEAAATVRILYPQVEIRRANTEIWLPLPQDAESVFGTGDALRTSRNGRAYLMLFDQAEVLILPNSTYEIQVFTQAADDTLHIAARLTGRMIQYADSPTVFSDYVLDLGQAVVTTPAAHFATQSTETGMAYVIVAQGEALLLVDNQPVSVAAGYGARAGETISPVTPIEAPASFARLDGILDGCPGVINNEKDENLNVRVGPTFAYDVAGTILNGTVVPIVGATQDRERYRIQFLSGFGWVVANSVETDCENLPVFPYRTFEDIRGVVASSRRELELLAPFFGEPEDDLWFFR
jgi:hypothetical protein